MRSNITSFLLHFSDCYLLQLQRIGWCWTAASLLKAKGMKGKSGCKLML